ncbi:MAG: T9SS type A sorting domain-containing protein, partial [Ignavibacteriaceae bacterium]
GNTDGFAPKLSVGTNNYFYGCRAWQNSDDGWDGYLSESASASTTVENSWCFMNGYLKDGSPSSGNGNGYKMGGGDNTNSSNLAHDFTLINSIAFDNRVKGFDQNNNRGSMILQNCTGYRNGTNYSIPAFINEGKTASVINSAVLGNAGIFSSSVIQQTNSWHPPFVVNTSDFISVDTAGVRGARKPDGSLPDVDFLHLADGSDLIDAGTDIGLPYMGAGPDLGAFESDPVVSVTSIGILPAGFGLLQNYPNPFNPSTSITYQLNSRGFVTLNVYNVLGAVTAVLVNEEQEAGVYEVQFNAENLASGIYFFTLTQGQNTQSRKMILMK